MKVVLFLLLGVAFSALAQQNLPVVSRIAPTDDTHPPHSQMIPDTPDVHTLPQPSNWKPHWTPFAGNVQYQVGHLVASHNDDSSDSPFNTYATLDKSGNQKKKH